ncbi:Oligopeptidase A [Seminavis robusta]|uniref:Oligopeptidase A n=1 Tax=Seminavis robusta TaxID=568900 RepID=A0A9N8EB73_9STRA|nr:Oligopeptidase A [Seminavis robusta]|eukprot:Sro890_g216740.1 Oligopeptidase A (723) ;mRNA; r:25136-27427
MCRINNHSYKRLLWNGTALKKRCFHSEYLGDVLRQRTWSPVNPILEDTKSFETTSTSSTSTVILPKYSQWRPHHMQDAVQKYPLQFQKDQNKLLETLKEDCSRQYNNQDNNNLNQILTDWDALQAPLHFLHGSCYALTLLAETLTQQQEWNKEYNRLQAHLPIPLQQSIISDDNSFSTDEEEEYLQFVQLLHACLQNALGDDINNEHDDNRSSASDGTRDYYWAGTFLLRKIQHQTGIHLPSDQRREFQQTARKIQSAQSRIRQMDARDMSSSHRPQQQQLLVDDTNTIVEVGNQNAKRLGYDNYLQQIVSSTGSRMATSEQQIRDMNMAVAELFQPLAEAIQHDPFDKQWLEKQHVPSPTLNGTLQALFQLLGSSSDSCLLGNSNKNTIEIIQQSTNDDEARDLLWHKENRIFHVYEDAAVLLGTIILDPFQRTGKPEQAFTIPLRHRRGNNHLPPLVAVSVNMSPPVWDNDKDVTITWEDAETLWHEFGHAMQFVLAQTSVGTLTGAQNMPTDVSEIVPKIMELCLFDESTLLSVMDFSSANSSSSSSNSLTPAMIETIHEWRLHRRALQSLQHAFWGTLELDLFTCADDASWERGSLVELKRQLAFQYIPHDLPAGKDDLSTILHVMQSNATGMHIGMYRYLWAEVFSAAWYRHIMCGDVASDDRRSSSNLTQKKELRRGFREKLLDPGAAVDTDKLLLGGVNDCEGVLETLMLDVYSR